MGINSLILIMPWEGSTQIIILPVPREGSISFSPCAHPDSTCPPNALEGERQGQPHTGKMDELESRFWERESRDGGEEGPRAEGRKTCIKREGNWLSSTWCV